MTRHDLFRPSHRKRGQALVEFSLTALVFLLLLVMVIEIGRILFAFVTLQHAARLGARYAVTGQWFEKYVTDPLAGWNPTTDDPLDYIPPCWPRFGTDPEAPTPDDYTFYEPYRNPRTCSVEETVVRAMTGLPLDPDAPIDASGYYLIRVSGVAEDRYPTTGTFRRGTTEYQYADYFDPDNPEFQGANLGLSPGFAGLPQQKVVVQVYYRLPLITPLLRPIAEAITLRGTAIMTNEAFGSTGLQRQAILPPDLPEVPPISPPTPADLTVTSLTLAESPPLGVDTDLHFDVVVKNNGSFDIDDTFALELYASPTPLGAPPWSGLMPVGTVLISGLDAGKTTSTTFVVSFSAEGDYYIYAWVDAQEVVAEGNETNNVGSMADPIHVGSIVDLVFVSKSASPHTPVGGESVTYTMMVKNNGPNVATGVEVSDDLPAGLTFGSSLPGSDCSSSDGTSVTCNIASLAKDEEATAQFTAIVEASASGVLTNTASVSHTGPQTEFDPANNLSNPESILIGGVEVSLDASIDDNTPYTGQTVVYTVTLTNSGSATATDIEVTSLLPDGVTPLTADYTPWTVSSLTPGQMATLTIEAEVTATSGLLTATFEITSLGQQNISQETQATVTAGVQSVDLAVSKSVSPLAAVEGEQVTFTVRVTNNGPNNASRIQIIDQLPAELVYVSDNSGGAYDPISGQWAAGDLVAGDSRSIMIVATINTGSTEVTTLVNEILAEDVTADQVDHDLSNNAASADLLVNANADLELDGGISVNGGALETDATAVVGDTVVFELTVTNRGPSDAIGVVVAHTLPNTLESHLTVISVSDPDSLGGDGTWTVGDLAAGESRTLSVTAVVEQRSDVLTLMTTAQAGLDSPRDGTPSNNSLPLSLTLMPSLVDLRLSISPASKTAEFYSEVTYTITLRNEGTSEATDVEISLVDLINLDGSVIDIDTPVPAPTRGTFDMGTARWSIPNVPAGASAVLTITATVIDANAETGPQTYSGDVSLLSFGGWWDPTPTRASWTLITTWPAPLYVQLGGSKCKHAITWGDPTSGLEHGHPLIGEDVIWVPVRSLPNVTATSGISPSGGTSVYAPRASSWPTTRGTRLSNVGSRASDAALFFCRSEASNITVRLTDLATGRWKLTLLFFEPSTRASTYNGRRFGVTADDGTVILPSNFNIHAAAHTDDTSKMYLIVQSGRSVRIGSSWWSVPNVNVGTDHELVLTFSRTNKKAVISAIALEYVSAP